MEFTNCLIAIYRGTPPVKVFPKNAASYPAELQQLRSQVRTEVLQDARLSGQDSPTARIMFDLPSAADYTPRKRDDLIVVSGSEGGALDGYYDIKEIPPAQVGFGISYMELRVRSLREDKLGDDPDSGDNSGNIPVN